MLWIPALSVQEQVERVGAYVGIASFFGIALLAILYFAQARELKRLRDWAGRAPERARELEERVAEDAARRAEAQARPVSPVAAAAGGATAAASAGGIDAQDPPSEAAAAAVPDGTNGAVVAAAEGADATGAGVAEAPAPAGAGSNGSAADVALPGAADPEPDGASDDQAATSPGESAAADGAPAESEDAARAPGATAADGTPAPVVASPAVDPDGTREFTPVDAEASDAPDGEPAAGDRPKAGEAVGAGPAAAVPAGPRPATAAALRVGAPPTRVVPRPQPVTPGPAVAPRGRGKLIGIGLAAVLTLIAGAFALSTIGGDDPATEPNVAQTDTPTPTPTPTVDVAATRGDTTVAVLNGTTTNGLAARLVEKLTAAGYREGPRGNYADQQRATSVVLYREGAADRARDVASLLDVSDVAPIDAQTAAQPIGDAQVVVVAGHDQAP